MITQLSVRNFQSLRNVDMELGSFTVIVGASSSGKSALMRAFRAVSSNVRGTNVITRGQKQMAISVRTDSHLVTLERSEATGTYRLADGSQELAFTKLNGGVPDAITSALRIEPVPSNGSSINFASQFDKPYLLDESGAVIARELGELTNVRAIFEAVRSANRIRNNAASTLRTREEDLKQLKTRMSEFSGLPERLKLVAEVTEEQERARKLQTAVDRLGTLTRYLVDAGQMLAKAAVVEPPDIDPVRELLTPHQRLRTLITEIEAADEKVIHAQVLMLGVKHRVSQLEQELATLLRDAGVCPTCGQRTL